MWNFTFVHVKKYEYYKFVKLILEFINLNYHVTNFVNAGFKTLNYHIINFMLLGLKNFILRTYKLCTMTYKFIYFRYKSLNYDIINFVLIGSELYTQNLKSSNYGITKFIMLG